MARLRPSKKMLHDEKLLKRVTDKTNPMTYKQLSAASRGVKVNHLGRGHSRTDFETNGSMAMLLPFDERLPSPKSECLACAYGNDAVYLHTC